MAYPTVSGPYGFEPVNLIGGQVFAGSTRNYPIAYNYGTALYTGDFVTLSSGYVIAATLPISTTNTTVGVFMGCYYTSPQTKQRLFSQFYPANVAAGDITAIIADDPDTVFKVAVTAAATGAGSLTIASASSLLVGQNMAGNTLTALAGSPTTGNGAGAVVTASTNTSGAGFRVLGLVPDTQVSFGGTANAAYAAAVTTVVINGLPAGAFIPVGTDLYNVVNGQLQFLATVGTAVTSATATAQSFTVTATAAAITSGGALALVQSPEVLVKLNFGAHRYYVA
jgi:hypothetical protein